MAKENFLLRKDLVDLVEDMSDEDVAQLFRGILNYVNYGDSKLTGLMNVIFVPIKKEIDKNEERYKDICDKRKDAVEKRWKKEKQPKKTEEIQLNTNVYN